MVGGEILDEVDGEIAVIDLVGTNPIRDGGFKTLGTDEIGANPDGFESFPQLRMVVEGLWTRFLFARRFSVDRFISVQLGDGVLAVVVTDLAELFKALRLIVFRSFLIAQGNTFEVFPFRFWTHKTPCGLGKV